MDAHGSVFVITEVQATCICVCAMGLGILCLRAQTWHESKNTGPSSSLHLFPNHTSVMSHPTAQVVDILH